MLNANYNDKHICSLDIRNIYRIKNIEIEKEWKIASRKGLITCTDCGSILIFKSGDIKTPHFAHKELSVNCESYQTEIKESEQHYKGVIIMNKIKKVGFLSKNIINYVGANLPEKEIILTKEVDTHIKNSHPNDYIYLNNIEDIINFPDYVGINSKHPNSMEFIKIMGDNILVAVRLSDNNGVSPADGVNNNAKEY